MTRDRAGQPWRARRREIVNRIVRETDPPTDTLSRITNPGRMDLDAADNARVGEVLDLAGTIGAILMASGMPATATMDQVTAITAAYGIERCEVDVINTTIHVAAYRGPTSPPASTLHIVQSRSMDFSRLAAVDRLIGRIRAGQVSSSTARDELDAIITAPHPYKRWIATLAWGALAFATAGTLGAPLLACLVSALSAMTIYLVNRQLNRHGLPPFFQYAVGGAIATAPPLVLYWLSPKLGLQFEPTVAIAAGLVVLLAGLSLVGSVGDVITGAPVTAAGRFFELVMMTAATIAGVALVLHLANRFGAPFVAISASAPPALAELPARVAFGAASAAAYALACYAERSAAVAAAFGGAAGTIVFLLAHGAGLGAVVASFAAAVPIGLVGRLMERRNLAPPMVVSIAGIVPLLPGLALLHGIYAILNDQQAVGFASVLGALAIGTALAAGVTLGEWSSWKGSAAPPCGSSPQPRHTSRPPDRLTLPAGRNSIAECDPRLAWLHMGVTIRLGLQIPNFTYGTSVPELFPAVKAQAEEAEAAGFDTVLLMDHFYQLPGLGEPDEPMLEAYTALGALASVTERVQLSTLVTGNTYRNPTLLAKVITTLDVVSAGRAILGIGAGWFELEHEQLGFEFDTFTERFEKLEEALQIIVPMLHGERPSFSGKWYHTENAVNEPRYRDHIPVMLGGSGEKKTFRLAARYADHLNIIADMDELAGKVDVLRQRCAEIDRDPATLETSCLLTVTVDGYDAPRDIGEARSGRAVSGTPDQIAEEVKRRVLDAGIDGVIINLPTHRYTPGVITEVGNALRPLVDA